MKSIEKKLITHNTTKYVALPKQVLDMFGYGNIVKINVNKNGEFIISKSDEKEVC